mmetsp:Transcript_79296/g.201841  ORF Transcript_79296/g.201841 Transcript_79296/m.201841 type:complete len:145 (+) Transcript_79296:53-487(+)
MMGLRPLKVVLRVLGAVVSGLFFVQAIWIFVFPEFQGFWDFCHWLAEGLLGVIVGGIGCYFEVRGSMVSVTRHFRSYALNRLGLCIFYFWLGCYIMGGTGAKHAGETWRSVVHATGFISWIVAVGDLLVAFSAGGSAEDEEALN